MPGGCPSGQVLRLSTQLHLPFCRHQPTGTAATAKKTKFAMNNHFRNIIYSITDDNVYKSQMKYERVNGRIWKSILGTLSCLD